MAENETPKVATKERKASELAAAIFHKHFQFMVWPMNSVGHFSEAETERVLKANVIRLTKKNDQVTLVPVNFNPITFEHDEKYTNMAAVNLIMEILKEINREEKALIDLRTHGDPKAKEKLSNAAFLGIFKSVNTKWLAACKCLVTDHNLCESDGERLTKVYLLSLKKVQETASNGRVTLDDDFEIIPCSKRA